MGIIFLIFFSINVFCETIKFEFFDKEYKIEFYENFIIYKDEIPLNLMKKENLEDIVKPFKQKNRETKFYLFYHFLKTLKKGSYEGIANFETLLKYGVSNDTFSYYLMEAAKLLNFGGILAKSRDGLEFFIKLSEENPEKIAGFYLKEHFKLTRENFYSDICSWKNYQIVDEYNGEGFSFYKISELPEFAFDLKCSFEDVEKIIYPCSSYLSDYLRPLPKSFEIFLMIGIEEVKAMGLAKK